jgi:hypothetical protein
VAVAAAEQVDQKQELIALVIKPAIRLATTPAIVLVMTPHTMMEKVDVAIMLVTV